MLLLIAGAFYFSRETLGKMRKEFKGIYVPSDHLLVVSAPVERGLLCLLRVLLLTSDVLVGPYFHGQKNRSDSWWLM